MPDVCPFFSFPCVGKRGQNAGSVSQYFFQILNPPFLYELTYADHHFGCGRYLTLFNWRKNDLCVE